MRVIQEFQYYHSTSRYKQRNYRDHDSTTTTSLDSRYVSIHWVKTRRVTFSTLRVIHLVHVPCYETIRSTNWFRYMFTIPQFHTRSSSFPISYLPFISYPYLTCYLFTTCYLFIIFNPFIISLLFPPTPDNILVTCQLSNTYLSTPHKGPVRHLCGPPCSVSNLHPQCQSEPRTSWPVPPGIQTHSLQTLSPVDCCCKFNNTPTQIQEETLLLQ